MFRFFACLSILFASAHLSAKEPARPRLQPKMSYLENDRVKLGLDLAVGGAITYLSVAGKDANIVNNWDWGRQIQMSHYAGPVPFAVGDKRPAEHWKHLGWNPVQAGDDFRHPSKVLETKNDGKELYVKCAPMQWPLDNVTADCVFESWLTLDGPTVNVRSKITLHREDKTFHPARTQELPAVYVNAPYHRLFTCQGGRKLTRVTYTPTVAAPWTSWFAAECWAALVNDDDFGLGVCHPGCHTFSGGFAGKPGRGGTHDPSAGYIAPNMAEHLDHHGEYEFTYFLIVGTLADIRAEAVKRFPKPTAPNWAFAKDRQHWTLANAADAGWPITGELVVDLSRPDPQLVSPAICWPADDAPAFHISAAFRGKNAAAQLFWSTAEKPGFAEERSVKFAFDSGTASECSVKLKGLPEWKGTITGLRLDPAPGGEKGASIRVKGIGLGK